MIQNRLFKTICIVGILTGMTAVHVRAESFTNTQSMSPQYTTTMLWFDFEGQERYDIKGSKYYLSDRTRTGTYNSVPIPLRFQKEFRSQRAFGLNVSWSRKGYNWIDIVPTAEHPLYDKPFPGHLKAIDFWVWGANYDYMLYITLENEHGFSYDLPVGHLRFIGWRKMHVKVPASLRVKRRQLAKEIGGLKFRRFRIYTGKLERVDQYSFFIDYMRIHTDLYGGHFDGVELERVFFEDEEAETSSPLTPNNQTPSSGAGASEEEISP